MDALKNAVNGFIEATAKENDQIQDKTKQHNISVVKFADDSYNESYGDDLTGDDYNYTQRLNALTSYTSGTVSELTDKVNSLQEAGATSADYGLTMAQTELKANGRKDAQKVVIFFTDGEPNHSNGFSNTVANAAISKSQELKKMKRQSYILSVYLRMRIRAMLLRVTPIVLTLICMVFPVTIQKQQSGTHWAPVLKIPIITKLQAMQTT